MTDLTTAAITVKATSKDLNNKFYCPISGLKGGTKYFYRAFVLFNGIRTYGNVNTFITKNDVGVNIQTNSATDISEFQATLNGTAVLETTEQLGTSVYFLYSPMYSNIDELSQFGRFVLAYQNDDGSYFSKITDLSYGTEYYYIIAISINIGNTVSGKTVYGDVKSFKTLDCPPELIDLGLSVKWRSWNLGATQPEDYGNKYAWGETETKQDFDWSSYKWGNEGNITKYNSSDKLTILQSEDDVAHSLLGNKWRMPTKEEFNELFNNCTHEWTTIQGIRGFLFFGQKQGYTNKWIFLPSQTYSNVYWSASLDSNNPEYAYAFPQGYNLQRYWGAYVRPVSE